jgi:putative two-component system response regulator
VGDRLCGNLRALNSVRPIVRHHHERLDGSGYPDGLSGDSVPLLAQIISIVDLYDAVTTERTYHRAQAADVACQLLLHEARRGWRRIDLVETFVATVREGRLEAHAHGFNHLGARSGAARSLDSIVSDILGHTNGSSED